MCESIDHIGLDPTHARQSSNLLICAALNIPYEPDSHPPNVHCEAIPISIHFYATPALQHLYEPDSFFYAWGPFSARQSLGGATEITLRACGEPDYLIALPRQPGDVTDTDTYQTHCPEAACPTVLLMGTVESATGRVNSGPSLMYYDLHSTVYDSSTKSSVSFTVAAYFRNGARWANFPPLKLHTHIMVAAHVIGITTDDLRLALMVDDVYFLPTLPYAPPTPTGAGSQIS
ncbi:hypothetical protein PDE_04007 [Penicillium oxalicum 114-2]|uniref:Uncharacterized protein n=1 Tax=Penicillium oxalicum (strain 114-2 / CGMCC 5302) TaxID=933388 RepID=S7ZEH0_PENO1|nr:hypothetical protein PDE_04007 [Penicillium oxalicum 114-2]